MMSRLGSYRKLLVYTFLISSLVFVFACGGTAPETTFVDREVIREVPKEIIVEKQVIKEVPKEIIVEKEVVKEVVREVVVTVTPKPVAVQRPWERWADQGKYGGGEIPFVAARDPGFWDLHYASSLNTALIPSGVRFNQLLEYDPINPDEVIGDLAESWEVNPSGDVYTFRLHEARFTDGAPVTAQDVVYSVDRWVEPGAIRSRTGVMRSFYEPGNARAIDSTTVEIKLKIPAGTFTRWMASDWMKIYPQHVVEGQSQDDLNCCPENLIGSGPFIFKSWERGDSYSHEKNPDYFKPGLPYLDGFKVFLIKDYQRRVASIKTEQVMGDYRLSSGVRVDDLKTLEEETEGRVRGIVSPNTFISGYMQSVNKPPLDDPRVRRAIYLVTDRVELNKSAHRGVYNMGQWFHPGHAFTSDEASQWPGFRYVDPQGNVVQNPWGRDDIVKHPDDIAEAKRLVKEAGAEGFKGTFAGTNAQANIDARAVLKQQLENAFGWELTLDSKPLATFYVDLRNNTHPLWYFGGHGAAVALPDDLLFQFYMPEGARNPAQWSHPRILELNANLAMEFEPQQRQVILREMIEDVFLTGEGQWIPLIWIVSGSALNVKIRNYHTPKANFTTHIVHKMEHLWFDPDATPDTPLP